MPFNCDNLNRRTYKARIKRHRASATNRIIWYAQKRLPTRSWVKSSWGYPLDKRSVRGEPREKLNGRHASNVGFPAKYLHVRVNSNWMIKREGKEKVEKRKGSYSDRDNARKADGVERRAVYYDRARNTRSRPRSRMRQRWSMAITGVVIERSDVPFSPFHARYDSRRRDIDDVRIESFPGITETARGEKGKKSKVHSSILRFDSLDSVASVFPLLPKRLPHTCITVSAIRTIAYHLLLPYCNESKRFNLHIDIYQSVPISTYQSILFISILSYSYAMKIKKRLNVVLPESRNSTFIFMLENFCTRS